MNEMKGIERIKQFFENENKDLKDELEIENDKNIKLTNINSEYEQAIKDLKLSNKNIKDRADVQIKNRDNQINDQKSKLYLKFVDIFIAF